MLDLMIFPELSRTHLFEVQPGPEPLASQARETLKIGRAGVRPAVMLSRMHDRLSIPWGPVSSHRSESHISLGRFISVVP